VEEEECLRSGCGWWVWNHRSRHAIVHADEPVGGSFTRCHSRPAVPSVCEGRLNVIFCCVKGEIPDIKFSCHMVVLMLFRRVSAAVSGHRISNRH
jgi:hypothetical protein